MIKFLKKLFTRNNEIQVLIAENERLRKQCAEISAELGLPPFLAPAPGVLASMVAENARLRELTKQK